MGLICDAIQKAKPSAAGSPAGEEGQVGDRGLQRRLQRRCIDALAGVAQGPPNGCRHDRLVKAGGGIRQMAAAAAAQSSERKCEGTLRRGGPPFPAPLMSKQGGALSYQRPATTPLLLPLPAICWTHLDRAVRSAAPPPSPPPPPPAVSGLISVCFTTSKDTGSDATFMTVVSTPDGTWVGGR